jgi:hypothetical protein
VDIDFKNGVYYLSGRVDEYAEFESLTNAPAPLKLNIGKVTSINSVGVRKFLAFTIAWSPRKFEFFECTPEFIANVNVIPQMLGTPSDETQIKTFFIPFACETCKRVENILVQREALKADAHGDLVLPQKNCAKCGEPLELDVEPNEYFMFLRGD